MWSLLIPVLVLPQASLTAAPGHCLHGVNRPNRTCTCLVNWTGKFCDIPMCDRVGGKLNREQSMAFCSCFYGYYGHFCHNYCPNGKWNGTKCTCHRGWAPPTCENCLEGMGHVCRPSKSNSSPFEQVHIIAALAVIGFGATFFAVYILVHIIKACTWRPCRQPTSRTPADITYEFT